MFEALRSFLSLLNLASSFLLHPSQIVRFRICGSLPHRQQSPLESLLSACLRFCNLKYSLHTGHIFVLSLCAFPHFVHCLITISILEYFVQKSSNIDIVNSLFWVSALQDTNKCLHMGLIHTNKLLPEHLNVR